MLKRWLVGIVTCLLLGAGAAAAQDGGSSLQAWADTYTSAFDVTQQTEWPSYERTFAGISAYNTTDPVTPSCSSGHSYSLWHTFVASQTGRINLLTLGNNFDTVTAVYKTTPTNANQVACFNTTSDVDTWDEGVFSVKAGTRYYVLFAATGTGTGVDSTSQLRQLYYTNYYSAYPFQIPASGVYNNIQDRIETASSGYEQAGTCNDTNYTVYYKFRPTRSGVYEFSTVGSSYDTTIQLYGGNGVNVCNENISLNNRSSRLQQYLLLGSTYYLEIGQAEFATPALTEGLVLSLRVRRL